MEQKLCECGCGELVKLGNRFIRGHSNKGKKHSKDQIDRCKNSRNKYPNGIPVETRICMCKCNQTFECKINSKQRFIHGHNNKGMKLSIEHRKNLSEAHMGINKGKTLEEILGIEKARNAKKKMHKVRKGKTYDEIYGIKKANEVKKKMSKVQKGKILSEKTRKKMSKAARLNTAKRIEKNYGLCWPCYNKSACEFFKSFDEQHNTKGQYAMYGGGEYFIKELGYWVDYFNPDLKLIIEYDEKHHFDENGNLREYDIIRQQEIQTLYPDFKFERIREK